MSYAVGVIGEFTIAGTGFPANSVNAVPVTTTISDDGVLSTAPATIQGATFGAGQAWTPTQDGRYGFTLTGQPVILVPSDTSGGGPSPETITLQYGVFFATSAGQVGVKAELNATETLTYTGTEGPATGPGYELIDGTTVELFDLVAGETVGMVFTVGTIAIRNDVFTAYGELGVLHPYPDYYWFLAITLATVKVYYLGATGTGRTLLRPKMTKRIAVTTGQKLSLRVETESGNDVLVKAGSGTFLGVEPP